MLLSFYDYEISISLDKGNAMNLVLMDSSTWYDITGQITNTAEESGDREWSVN